MPPPTLRQMTLGWGWFAAGTAGVIAMGAAAAILRPVLFPQNMVVSSAPNMQPGVLPPLAGEAPPSAAGPSFDVVRITPQGDAVIAGRAAPGTEVTVREGAREIGRAMAGPDGTWVLTPSSPLPEGDGTLIVAGPDGKAGMQSVVVSVGRAPQGQAPPGHTPPGEGPVQTAGAATPLAVLTTPGAAPTVLQGPGRHDNRLALQALDYGQSGSIRFSGRAPPKSTVRVYVDNRPVGQGHVEADGTWAVTPGIQVSGGMHRLRLDQLAPNGKVVARIDLPFTRESVVERALAPGTVIVQPGQSLWLIARASYGEGIRYTLIFDANREEICNPSRIYPGQVFEVPPAR